MNYDENKELFRTRLEAFVRSIVRDEIARDRDGSGKAGQTAKQAGPEGQQPDPQGIAPKSL